ncbi:hypothetical protein VKT23_007701 [Stygiomarasmius scandens]|uniref:F-box domain-containing protein n=1 Tax=Marasmiellus scandens TaxID=2682957 RepID=A0ABR1JLJ6_9AGAR
MSTLENFPTELLIIAFGLLDASEKKTLRYVCRRFNLILKDLLFSKITISTDRSVLAQLTIPFCEALCNYHEAQDSLSTHARQVKVITRQLRKLSSAESSLEIRFNDIIGPTVASLCNLKSFHLQIHGLASESTWTTLLPAISSNIPSKTLNEFSLSLDRIPDSHESSAILKSLGSHFTTLIVRARGHRQLVSGLLGPNLQRLIITPQRYPSSSCSLHDIFGDVCVGASPPLQLTELTVHKLDMRSAPVIWERVVGHLKPLKRLDIALLDDDQTPGELWSTLHANKICLTRLTYRGVVDNNLLRYLRDFGSALESLTLQAINLNSSQEEFDGLADEFYRNVLPTLGDIRKLEIQPSFDGRWCFGPHNADGFYKYTTKLGSFTVSLNGERLSESITLAYTRASALDLLKFFSLSHTYSTSGGDMAREIPEALERCGIGNAQHIRRSWKPLIEMYKITRISHDEWVYEQKLPCWAFNPD